MTKGSGVTNIKFKFWIYVALICLGPAYGHAVTPMINAGAAGSIFLNSDGSVWGTGQVTNYLTGATSPVRLLGLTNVVSVASSNGADLALLGDGTVWASGANDHGQLGDGTTLPHSDPRQVSGLFNVTDIKSGGHVLALKADGTVWAWGQNEQGQLGDGTKVDRYSPVQVTGLSNVIQISAASVMSLALKSDGTVWVWGFTCCGNAGDGHMPTAGGSENNHLVPSRVLNLDRVVAISAGPEHSLALQADGTVWTWGRGDEGQNGNGSFASQPLPVPVPGLSNVVGIEARGMRFSVALKADGSVWASGINNMGQLGVSGLTFSATPIQVPGLSDIVAIATGLEHVLAMRRDGTVFAWGGNSNGRLGDGTLQNRPEPRPVLGPGGSGQLNLLQAPPANPNQLPSAQIGFTPPSGRAPLTVTFNARNATDPDGTIRAYYWQASDGRQATGPSTAFVFSRAGTYTVTLLVEDNAGGRGTASVPVVVTPAAVTVSVEAKANIGSFSSTALASDGRILTWGQGNWLGFAQPGVFHLKAFTTPVANGVTGAVDFVQGGSPFTDVLMADGTVLGWGPNESGQVGAGSQANVLPQPQSLSNLPPVQALAAGGDHVLALSRDGRVFGWGRNAEGQLGLGDNQNRNSPVEISGSSGVTAIAAGTRFSMALRSDGTVWVWGDNSGYQLGDGSRVSRNGPIQVPGLANVQKIFATPNNAIVIVADGTVWASGFLPFSFAGDAMPPPAFRRVPVLDGAVQLAGSGQHIIFRKADGTVWVVGRRSSLALGVEGTGDIQVPQQVPGITDASWVSASVNNSMVLRRDGTVLVWGLNGMGMLGDGTVATRSRPVLVVNETADGPLDLITEVPNNISADLIPLFYVATTKSGELNSTSLSVDVKGPAIRPQGQFAAGYNVYVAASVPASGAPLFFQLDASNTWGSLRWPMAEFMRGVALDSQNAVVTADIFQNTDLTSVIGSTLYVGYGLDADEMVARNRYRDIFTVTQPQ